jgi:FHA domain
MASENSSVPGAEESKGSERARLISIGAAAPREYPLDGAEISIGSAPDNDLVINESSVSRHHARLFRRLGNFRVADLESTNGTFVNGRRVRGSANIRRGDEIRFGTARFAFVTGARYAVAPSLVLSRIGPGTAVGILVLLFLAAFEITRSEFVAPRNEMPRAKTAAVPRPSAAPSSVPSAAEREHAAAAAPTSALSREAAPAAPEPPWLAMLNRYRRIARLNPVTRDAKLDAGDRAHVNYLFQNYAATIRGGAIPGLEMHLETPGNPWYTADGATAGRHSDVDYVYWEGYTPAGVENFAIQDWIGGAFHRLPLLSPRLRAVGYNDRCEDHVCIAALNAQTDLDPAKPGEPYAAPVEFPPSGGEIDMTSFTQEWPDPLASCPGYKRPTSLPITLQLGAFLPATMQSFTVERIDAGAGAVKLQACGFDLSNYNNPALSTETTARQLLKEHGAVVVIPRRPLEKGASYRVSITANGKPYQWTFSVAR